MTDPIELALAGGDTAAVEDAASMSTDALVVDWRNPAAAILADVAAIAAMHGVEIDLDGTVDGETPGIDALPVWNAVLLPAVELRVLRSTAASDTRVALVRPASWWRAMAERHGDALEAVFAPLPATATEDRSKQPVRRGRRSRTAALLRYPGEWVGDPAVGAAVRDRALAQLQDALRSPLGVGKAVVSIRLLGTFHQLAGQAAVLAGDGAGWQSLRLGYRFASTATHLSDRLYMADPRPGKPPRTNEWEVGHCVALGLALEVPAEDGTFGVFRRRMRTGTLGESRGPFARYLEALCQVRDGSSDALRFDAAELGPWQGMLATWDDSERFAAAMLAALEYHVERAVPSNRHLGEFEGGPEQAFPTELVAATHMREAKGLATPRIDHPLWQTPLVATRPSGPWPEDSLLSRCVAYADEVEPPHPDELLAANPGRGARVRLGHRLRRTFGRWFGDAT